MIEARFAHGRDMGASAIRSAEETGSAKHSLLPVPAHAYAPGAYGARDTRRLVAPPTLLRLSTVPWKMAPATCLLGDSWMLTRELDAGRKQLLNQEVRGAGVKERGPFVFISYWDDDSGFAGVCHG